MKKFQLRREKLSNQVYAILKEMIANYRFQPGARINVEEIAKELSVSRTPVWEAISRLEQEGLVEHVPNVGTFMKVLTPEEALNLYEVREVLEGMAARLAATRIKDSAIEKMAKCLEKQKEVIRKQDLIGYSRLDFEFHAVVYEACGNPYLQELLETLKNKMRPITMHIKHVLPRLYKDHKQLLEAIRARDPERAEKAFRMHNQLIMRLLQEEILKKEAKVE